MNLAYKLENIEYAYGTEVVLHIDEYLIKENTISSLVGPNGSGKSTLLNLLAFITRPSGGQLHFFETQVSDGDTTEQRRHTAYVQQKPYLFNYSVLQNIELGLKLRGVEKQLRRQRAEAIAGKLQLQDLLSKRAHEISGGEIQKVAIARALVLEPRVLLLDEPFTHLDKRSKVEIEKLLQAIKEGGSQTIIFSSHDQIQAQNLADNICNLEKGRICSRAQTNTFTGRVEEAKGIFNTGKLEIHIPSIIRTGTQIAVESTNLVLSREKLKSSMRNHFQGRITSLQESNSEIHVTVEAGESWHVIITNEALNELDINIGEQIWLSFKSTVVQVF